MLNYFFLIYKFIIIGCPVCKNFLGVCQMKFKEHFSCWVKLLLLYTHWQNQRKPNPCQPNRSHKAKKKKKEQKTQIAQGLNWLPSPPKPVALVQVAPYKQDEKILQREHKVRQTDKVKWPQSVCRRTYQSAGRGVMTSKMLLFSFLGIFSQQEVRTVVGRRGGCPQGKGSFGSC